MEQGEDDESVSSSHHPRVAPNLDAEKKKIACGMDGKKKIVCRTDLERGEDDEGVEGLGEGHARRVQLLPAAR